jgi:hypothetical protein
MRKKLAYSLFLVTYIDCVLPEDTFPHVASGILGA